ncbi:ABC transporter ATP-binding protein [Buchnera aphidicola (Melanaphis sacchari)]|uniref:ABC transporter ATP-binding protein n=1 Tax=Buchnera aphidicola (Melanaphis sacchari) TaxID=2173854 RepID=A0A2U8DFZ4_9GAMM|nr:ATP-binding cassette domain-containing protein [Buchnera aphidicola]AWH90431.1 ABC transporter ATP-binding protein [Buchnera aphidicola (Melanaphis sacchari)]
MTLISMQNASLTFSDLEILIDEKLFIEANERICLTGKNGSGKSTLLKIINKKQDLDNGYITYKKNIKISYLNQKNPENLNISTYDFFKRKIFKKDKKTKNFNKIIEIEKIIEKLKLKKNKLLSELSGGFLRKVLLGASIIDNPDILLLDEPTNHLDINTIQWLEKFLKKFSGSVLFVSHDRAFIQNICTRIIDLDRGKLNSFPGDYERYISLKRKEKKIEKIHKKLFDYTLKKEEKWIRKGIKARSTRNEGRVKFLEKLRKEKNNYKKIENLNKIEINQIKEYSGKITFELKNISFNIKDKKIIKNFSEIIQYGEKIGLIGSNGSGKSTMLEIITGEKSVKSGNIYHRKDIKIAYFKQDRSELNPEKSIIENIDHGKETFLLNGKEQNLIGYLKKFLFQPNQLRRLVKTLSGGECNRLLLAKIFLRPSNVLILDEPTNDLDINSLELLEKIIMQYLGTVFIVSHDRYFIHKTVNKYWFFKGNGLITKHIEKLDYSFEEKKTQKKQKKSLLKNKKNNIPLLLLYKKNIKKELEKTLNKIENIEKNIIILQKKTNEPNFFKKNINDQLPILKKLNEEEQKLEKKIIYWESLEEKL